MAANEIGAPEKGPSGASGAAGKSRVIKRNRGAIAPVGQPQAADASAPDAAAIAENDASIGGIREHELSSGHPSSGESAPNAAEGKGIVARKATRITLKRPVITKSQAPVASASAHAAAGQVNGVAVGKVEKKSASQPAGAAGSASAAKPGFVASAGVSSRTVSPKPVAPVQRAVSASASAGAAARPEVIIASAGKYKVPRIIREEKDAALPGPSSRASGAVGASGVPSGAQSPSAADARLESGVAQASSKPSPEVIVPVRKRFTIIKDSSNLPPIRPVGGTTPRGRALSAGVVGGRAVDTRNGRLSPGRNAGGYGRTPFRVASMNKPFEPANSKRKTAGAQKKGGYRERTLDEREFDVAKRKKINTDIVPKRIDIMSFITPGELARKMNLKAGDIISKLISMGSMVTINEQIDSDTATIIANEFGCEVHIVDLYQETIIENMPSAEENLKPRAPIVTVMGHVDHGKTKLLDAIRESDVVSTEAGGITQHIGAYKVKSKRSGDEIVFIDTPGHAAFSEMRARGAKVTDIVVLVVAANDGVMPQTVEAIDHAKAAKVPIIVAINKCDLPEANPDRVMQQLSEYALVPEEWGGDTQFVRISAKLKEGIDDLLDSIIAQAEMLDLKADPTIRATGTILEARIDQGRGVVATVLVREGRLAKGDNFVVGIHQGHVKTMTNDKGVKINEAFPSTPVEISGLSDVPKAGDPFQVTEDEHVAKVIATKRQELARLGQLNSFKRISLENVYDTIKEMDSLEFNIIVKGDVQGSVEAISSAIQKLETPQIRPVILRSQAGAIIEDDINLASSAEGGALVIAFNVRPTPRAQAKADAEKIEIRKYSVIYDIIEDIKSAMEGKLSPVKKEIDVGKLEVRQIFKVPKVGIVAGCMVTSGKITRKCFVRVIRENVQVSQNPVRLSSLKRFKDDAREILEGFECGVGLENFQDLQVGDTLEAVEVVEVAQSLDFSGGAAV